MLTLKEMIINVLAQNGPITVKNITDEVMRAYPEKIEQKIVQQGGDAQKGRNQLYREIHGNTINADDTFYRDKSTKPLTVGLLNLEDEEEKIEIESQSEDFDKDEGTVYILGTQTYTKDGKELVKIGLTTLPVKERIRSLFTSGVPFEFTIKREYATSSYAELEKAMHKLLDRFRPNKAREFFTEECLVFADEIYALHRKIEKI